MSKELEKIYLKCGNDVFNKISGEFDVPELVVYEFKNVLLNYASKYWDDLLKHNGLFLHGTYPGGYTAFLDTVSAYYNFEFPWLSKYRIIRFKISEVGQEKTIPGVVTKYGLSFDDLTNSELVFLDKDGFELRRVDVGLIKSHGWATGEFHIKESDYCNIAKIFLVTDQDR